MYLKKYNLRNKIALVTGAGKGLGAKAKDLSKSSVGKVKKLNPFKKNKE